jgi:hypothetical protein
MEALFGAIMRRLQAQMTPLFTSFCDNKSDYLAIVAF